MKTDTFGWFKITEVVNLCRECTWRLEDHTMASCECGEHGFPKARNCNHFKHEDDE